MSYDLNFKHVSDDVKARARPIKVLLTDVDGVLTEGQLYLAHEAEGFKGFNILDGLGAKLLQNNGIQVAIITGRNSTFVLQRADALGIRHVYQGCENKLAALDDILYKTGCSAAELAHIGDDLPDVALLQTVGLGIAVANAHPFVAQHAHWQTQLAGGRGAFRECADMLLAAQGKLDAVLAAYRV